MPPRAASPTPSGKPYDPLTQLASPSPPPSSTSIPSSPIQFTVSPPSPSVKPPPDLVYLTGLRGMGLGHHQSVSRLELLTRALAHRALADSPRSEKFLPLNLSPVSSIHHTDIKPIPNLNHSFNSNSSLNNNHLNSNSSSGGGSLGVPLVQSTSNFHGGMVHTCQRCGKTYGVRRSLHRHQKFECGVEPKFMCPVCNKKCTHKFNLKQHMLSHHKYEVS